MADVAGIYTDFKDHQATADFAWAGSTVDRCRAYLVDDAYTPDFENDTMATISAHIHDGGSGIATSISADIVNRVAAGGVLNADNAVFATPESSGGAIKRVIIAWIEAGAASVTDWANIHPMCQLKKAVVPDGTEEQIDFDDTGGILNWNGVAA